MPIRQTARVIAVGTPLGDDVLVFGRMTGTEQIGRLFEFTAELLSENDSIKLQDLLGQNITVRLELPQGGTRYFNGFVSNASYGGVYRSLVHYRVTLRPWLWFLTRTANCRIFQEKSVPDIIKQVFQDHGFTDFQDLLSGSYRQWVYCVQYRETDFNFVSRLMEQEGIYYYFKHDNGKHILVLADSYSSHDTIPNYDTVPYYPPDEMDRRIRDHIYDWELRQSVQPGSYALDDYNFEMPTTSLRSSNTIPRPHTMSGFEVYDYPGEYDQSGDGQNYAKLRIEELQAQYELAHVQGNAQGLITGCLFNLDNHPRSDQNKEYLITAASYELRSNEYESDTMEGETYFGMTFTAMPSQTPYRAPRITPKPVVQGPQTAVVVGPKGEEIYTDKYGRIKVQFHWDREGKADEKSSCWIRVAQYWAGKKWGAMYVPRIGQEVIVEFLEGDPDQPIATGRVYNGVNMPPYDLPGNQTVSTVKSNSSKGGGGFNEIRFEDKKGKEQIFVHAQRNYDTRVRNTTYETVGNYRHLIVQGDQREKVKGDKHLLVEGDHKEKIGGDQHLEVVGSSNNKIGQDLSMKVGMDMQQKVGMKHALDAGMEIHLKAGMNVVIEAGMSITLKAGGGFIVVGPTGVTISGAPVLINSGGSAGSGSGCSPEAPEAPDEAVAADTAKAGQVEKAKASPVKQKPQQPGSVKVSGYSNSQAQTLSSAAESGTPFCEVCNQ